MATKRRKVWVNFYQDGSNDGCAFETKGDAKENASTAYVMAQGAFVERLPGDVVRTKDEEVALESAVDRYTEAWEMAYATHTDEARRAVTACGRNLRALLRGRR